VTNEPKFGQQNKGVSSLFEIPDFPLKQNVADFNELQEIDFAQLDNYIEKKAREQK
jgi:hypothetical protein